MRTNLPAAAIIVLLASCSGTPTGEVKVARGKSEVEGKDACQLLTSADAKEVYGVDMTKSDRNVSASGPSANVSTCTYSNDGTPMVVVTITATWSKTTHGPLSSRDSFVESALKGIPEDLRKEMTMEKVEFQGLPAAWQPSLNQMFVFREGVMVAMVADAATGRSKRETIEALLAKVVGRL